MVPLIMENTNKWFYHLQDERKLSPATIQRAGLKESDGWLEIPVLDRHDNHIFSKYRKPFWVDDDQPKYKYDTGSKVSLYGIEKVLGAHEIYITEGELDALSLRTLGEAAVTSTGGALTFKKEWAPMFMGKDVIVIFDNDDAGIKGAVRTALMLKRVEYRWVPPLFGKDVSDVLQKYGIKKLHEILHDEKNCIRTFVPDLSTQRTIKEFRAKIANEAKQRSSVSIGTLFLREMVLQLTAMISTPARKRDRTDYPYDDEKEKAKAYPLENLLVFKNRKTKCPFHEENSASLHLYKDNTAFCFGCRKYADSIDIVMVQSFNHLQSKEAFKEAIKFLNNK